jgi:hypothetical protein
MSAFLLAYVPTEDVGMIVAAYAMVAAAGLGLAWRVLRKGRRLTRRVPQEEWPWT